MDIDAHALDDALTDASFSGVVTVDVGDERVLARAAGYANRPLRVPMTVDTRLAIASGSKAFTAVAVMRLVEEKALRLDQPVRELLGEDLPLVDDAVTIEHLLSHTSGIGDYLDEDSDWEPADYVLTVPPHTLTTAAAFLPLLEGHPQKFAPGERFSYCNSGYMVLALVLERVTGERYHDVVRRLVLTPARLEETDFLPLNALPAGTAVGYVDDDGDLTNTLHLPILGNGDGGAFTTAADLHRFWCGLLDGQILTRESVELLTRPRNEVPEEDMRYGMGFYLHETAPVLVLEGYDAGASFRSTHVIDSRTTVSVLGNTSEGAWPVIGTLAEAVDAHVG